MFRVQTSLLADFPDDLKPGRLYEPVAFGCEIALSKPMSCTPHFVFEELLGLFCAAISVIAEKSRATINVADFNEYMLVVDGSVYDLQR